VREFIIYLSEEDTARLFAIKQLQGRADITGAEFAAQLLENELYRLFPANVEKDSRGRITNADRYRGPVKS
jgi:hypothetical protein